MKARCRFSAGSILVGIVCVCVCVAACGNDSKPVTPTQPGTAPENATSPLRVTEVWIDSGWQLLPGSTKQLEARARLSDGTSRSCTADAVWSSSNPAAATVARGLVTAVANGKADIAASYEGVTGRTQVIVGLTVYGRVEDAAAPGAWLGGADVEIVSGTNAGLKTTTDDRLGSYSFRDLQLGQLTLRASKTGYDTATKTVSPTEALTAVNFSLTRAALSCVESVDPALTKYFPSAGGTGEFSVTASPGPTWTATAIDPWLQIVSGATGSGSGKVVFRAERNPQDYGSAFRTGSLAVGCSAADSRRAYIWQLPDCHASGIWRTGPTTVFSGTFQSEAAGGTVSIDLMTDSPFSCPWQAVSRADWITFPSSQGPASVVEGKGDSLVTVYLAPNTTGASRTGTVSIAEKTLTVIQKGQ